MNDPGLPERMTRPFTSVRFSSASKCADNSASTCDDRTLAPLLGSSNVSSAISGSGNESRMTGELGIIRGILSIWFCQNRSVAMFRKPRNGNLPADLYDRQLVL